MMQRREVIFLSGVVLAAVIFIYDRLAPSIKENKDLVLKNIAEVEEFVARQESIIDAAKLQPHETDMLNILMAKSPSNPFAREWAGMISDQKRMSRLTTVEPVLSYIGFIRRGDRFVALINDEDYEEGNKINEIPLSIRNITPEKIDVENLQKDSVSHLSIKIIALEVENDE